MIIKSFIYLKEFNFILNDYIIKNLDEKSRILVSSTLPDICLNAYITNDFEAIKAKDLKYKIYRYKNIDKVLKDYFSSDVSSILFRFRNKFYGLNIFTIDKIFNAEEFYLYEFLNHNERDVDEKEIFNAVMKIREVNISYYMKFKLIDNFVLEIEYCNDFRDFVVNAIDKFYCSNVIIPHFDIHYYKLNSIDNVKAYYMFTFHPNISEHGTVCYGKKDKSIANLSKLDMNYDGAYNIRIRFTSYRVNKKIVKMIIEKGGGLDV